MTLITPSKWLAGLVQKSFLKEYPIEVHYNTIDTSVFKPTSSDFKKKYDLENKKVVLGVASVWDKQKGLEDFYKLAGMLDNRYAIVLVGLSRKQISDLPKKIPGLYRANSSDDFAEVFTMNDMFEIPKKPISSVACEKIWESKEGVVIAQGVENLYYAIMNICEEKSRVFPNEMKSKVIGITRTNNAKILAELYTMADVFVNPTYEDNYPTVNLEARACGTKVITYNTGGCVETLQ